MVLSINVAVLLAVIIVVRLRRRTHARSRFDEKLTVVIVLVFGVLIAPPASGKAFSTSWASSPTASRRPAVLERVLRVRVEDHSGRPGTLVASPQPAAGLPEHLVHDGLGSCPRTAQDGRRAQLQQLLFQLVVPWVAVPGSWLPKSGWSLSEWWARWSGAERRVRWSHATAWSHWRAMKAARSPGSQPPGLGIAISMRLAA